MNAITRAIEAAGDQQRLAAALDVSKQAVNHWSTGIRRPSAKQARRIEELYGISRSDLRPDIFGPAPRPREEGGHGTGVARADRLVPTEAGER